MIIEEKDTPPAYQLTEFVDNTTTVRDDGRIDVDLDSKLGRALAILVPPPPAYPQGPEYAPRPINSPIKLNIVIQVVGSRGDVQPFIALGNELQKHGHRVRLATHNVFEFFVRESGLEFYPIGGDPAELMAYMVKNPGLIPDMKSLRGGDIQRKRAMVAKMLDGCWRSCLEPDMVSQTPFVAEAIIANPPSFAHIHCAQALGIPVHLMFTMPWTSTRAFPHPLANLKYSGTDPVTANYISYGIVELLTWQGLGDVINKWRDSIGLEPVPATEGPALVETQKIPFTYCWSPALVPKPTDWAAHIDICGFFFRDPPNYTPPPELDAFLRAGPPPIYIGFGSIVMDNPKRMSAILLKAVQTARVRAIISRGWSKLDGPALQGIFYLGDCPHQWLFQHVAAVVHHGGAGTTACGLLNAKPTVIVPSFGDQPFWGNMVAAAGAGPKPIPREALDVQNLTEAITYCLTPQAAEAARAIAGKMRSESGVKTAVASFHANLPLKAMQCNLFADRPAAWVLKKGKRKMRLSKLAAAVLVRDMGTNPKALKFYDSSRILVENRRWEPVTSTSSAFIGHAVDMVDAMAGIFLKPYEELQKRPPPPGPKRSPGLVEEVLRQPEDGNRGEGSSRALAVPTDAQRSGMHTAGAVAAASGKSFGRLVTVQVRGLLVDIPFATAEGLRSVPKLYGEPLRDVGRVRDWRSGAAVAGRSFGYGMADGISGLVMDPYRGAREEGVVGAAKGFGKGVIGFTTKTGSAALGLVAYPGQGIYKSIRAATCKSTRKQVLAARHAEGEWLLRELRAPERERAIAGYAELLKG